MKIQLVTKKEFNLFYSLQEKDFCLEERRSKQDELKALDDNRFKPFLIYHEDKVVGYCSCWEFDDFIFGEHFAIIKEFRTMFLGFRFFKDVLSKIKKLFVFEIEQPTDKLSRQRKMFYERLGVCVNEFKYSQPSYHGDGKDVPMMFLSYPTKLTKREFHTIVKQIKKVVYKLD